VEGEELGLRFLPVTVVYSLVVGAFFAAAAKSSCFWIVLRVGLLVAFLEIGG